MVQALIGLADEPLAALAIGRDQISRHQLGAGLIAFLLGGGERFEDIRHSESKRWRGAREQDGGGHRNGRAKHLHGRGERVSRKPDGHDVHQVRGAARHDKPREGREDPTVGAKVRDGSQLRGHP